jgi:hypothetical protein
VVGPLRYPALRSSMSIGGRPRVPDHAQSNVSNTPSSHPGWASSQLGLFCRAHKFCASNASSCTYSGCALRLRCVSGERSEYHGPVSGRTVACANHRQVTATRCAVPVRHPAACPIVVQLLSREPPASELTHRDVHVIRRNPVQMRAAQPHKSRVTRPPNNGPAHSCPRQPLRPVLAEPTKSRRQRQVAAIEHTDVPAFGPRAARLCCWWWPKPALVGQPLARYVGIVSRPQDAAWSDVGGVHPSRAEQRTIRLAEGMGMDLLGPAEQRPPAARAVTPRLKPAAPRRDVDSHEPAQCSGSRRHHSSVSDDFDAVRSG